MGEGLSLVKSKTITLVFVASLLLRTKTGRLGIGIFINVPEWSDMSSHSLVFFIRHAPTILLVKEGGGYGIFYVCQ